MKLLRLALCLLFSASAQKGSWKGGKKASFSASSLRWGFMRTEFENTQDAYFDRLLADWLMTLFIKVLQKLFRSYISTCNTQNIPHCYTVVLSYSRMHKPDTCILMLHARQGKALESLCSCTWKLCLFSSQLHMQALFCTLVHRVTSWFSPNFLSEKSKVICKPHPFQHTQGHAAVSSDDYGSHWNTHTHRYMFRDFGKAAKTVQAMRRMYKFLQTWCFRSLLGGCFSVSDVLPFSYICAHFCVFRRGVVMVSVLGKQPCSKCVCVSVCVFEHLLLVGFVFPPLHGPPLYWVLDSKIFCCCLFAKKREREEDRDSGEVDISFLL